MVKRYNDYDPLDENGVLKDGRSVRVSLMDAMSVRQQPRSHLHDGHGNPVGNRPGFVVCDAFSRDRRQESYEAYELEVTTAWKRDAREPGSIATQEGDLCTCRSPEYPDDFGSPGHVRWHNGRLTCVPDQPRARDATTIDEAYAEYCRELRNG